MYERIRNIALVAVAACVLFCVIGTKVPEKLGVDFPEWTGVGLDKSSLEGRKYQSPPKPGIRSALSGKFQTRLEKYLADHVPMRDEVLLKNAALQRSCIAAANTPFRFDSYPTFFDSIYVINTRGVVCRSVRTPTEKHSEAARALVGAINRAADAYPSTRFVFDIIEGTYSSRFNPTAKYSSNYLGKQWIEENYVNDLNDNVTVVYDEIETENEFFTEWFSTDHHWKLPRALKTYDSIGAILGWKKVPLNDKFTAIRKWHGSEARNGLYMDLSDSLEDYPIDFSDLECFINGKRVDRGLREKLLRNNQVIDSIPYGNRSYFGGLTATVTWKNRNKHAKGTCLFVEQSYGPYVERYIASNYSKTICLNPVNKKVEKPLMRAIEEYSPDTVVIQLNVVDAPGLIKQSPNFLT